ncbi:MAG: hypothetical protein L3J53_08060 [Proteobacteria bacterium]|nr:hypothetical protein [Pseudomonadota bacterium]
MGMHILWGMDFSPFFHRLIQHNSANSVKSPMVRVPDYKIYDNNYLPTSPYGGVERNESIFPANIRGVGSDLLISDYVSLAAAHVVARNDLLLGNVLADFLISYPGAIPNGSGRYNNFFGSILANDLIHSTTYNPSNIKVSEDYGAIRSFVPFPLAFYTGLIIDTSNPRNIRVVGYPGDRVGMHEGSALAEFDDFFCGSFDPAITYDIDTIGGVSGGPLFDVSQTYSTSIHTSYCLDEEVAAGVSFSQRNALEIQSWLWSPTGVMEILSPKTQCHV